MNLQDLLGKFRSEDIAHALRELGLPTTGNKSQRLERLLMAGKGTNISETLALFRTEDLNRVCVALGVDTGTQAQMVDGLAKLIAADDVQSAPDGSAGPTAARLRGLTRVGIIAALAALLYRGYRAIRRRR